MCSHGITESSELPVNGSLPERRLEVSRIEKDVDVFRKAADQIPAFRQARATLENDRLAVGGDDSQCFGDEVVLFDDRGAQSFAAKMFRRLKDRLPKIRMFE